MKILFDQGTPAPLRVHLTDHIVDTAFEKGWANLRNSQLLKAAEADDYDLLVTTDRHLKHQQNLRGRKLAILVILSTSWPRIQSHVQAIHQTIDSMQPGEYAEFDLE